MYRIDPCFLYSFAGSQRNAFLLSMFEYDTKVTVYDSLINIFESPPISVIFFDQSTR